MRFALAVALAMTACASAPKPMYARDGGPALYVECHHSKTYCFEAAEKRCPAGYLPLDESQRTRVFGMAQPSGGAFMGSAPVFDLTFRCK